MAVEAPNRTKAREPRPWDATVAPEQRRRSSLIATAFEKTPSPARRTARITLAVRGGITVVLAAFGLAAGHEIFAADDGGAAPTLDDCHPGQLPAQVPDGEGGVVVKPLPATICELP